jgi:hypothetical protein
MGAVTKAELEALVKRLQRSLVRSQANISAAN